MVLADPGLGVVVLVEHCISSKSRSMQSSGSSSLGWNGGRNTPARRVRNSAMLLLHRRNRGEILPHATTSQYSPLAVTGSRPRKSCVGSLQMQRAALQEGSSRHRAHRAGLEFGPN